MLDPAENGGRIGWSNKKIAGETVDKINGKLIAEPG